MCLVLLLLVCLIEAWGDLSIIDEDVSNIIDHLLFHDHSTNITWKVNVFQHVEPKNQALHYCTQYQLRDSHCQLLAMGIEEVYETFISISNLPRNRQFVNDGEVYPIGSIPLTVAPENKRVEMTIMSSPYLNFQVQSFCSKYSIIDSFCDILLEKAYEIYDNHHPVTSIPLHKTSIYNLTYQIQRMNINLTTPLKVLINTHPCAGKSTFLKKYGRKYKGFVLKEFDDFSTFPIRDRVQHILDNNNSNVAMLGGNNFGSMSDDFFDRYPNVVILWVFPPIDTINRYIISRQINTGASCENLHVWANPRNVMRIRALGRLLNIADSHAEKSKSIYPEFDSFETALDAVLTSRGIIIADSMSPAHD